MGDAVCDIQFFWVHKNKTKRQQRASSLLFSLVAQKQKKKR
jgi:hypothetical protein